MDSGAIDTVTPNDTAIGVPMKDTKAPTAGVGYVAANGTKIGNYGEKKIPDTRTTGLG